MCPSPKWEDLENEHEKFSISLVGSGLSYRQNAQENKKWFLMLAA